jgi:hypothetical protein
MVNRVVLSGGWRAFDPTLVSAIRSRPRSGLARQSCFLRNPSPASSRRQAYLLDQLHQLCSRIVGRIPSHLTRSFQSETVRSSEWAITTRTQSTECRSSPSDRHCPFSSDQAVICRSVAFKRQSISRNVHFSLYQMADLCLCSYLGSWGDFGTWSSLDALAALTSPRTRLKPCLLSFVVQLE